MRFQAHRRGTREHEQHVRLQRRHRAWILAIELDRGAQALPDLPVVHLVAVRPGLEQPVDGVRRHERVVLVRLPPPPPAVVVLVVEQSRDASRDLAIEQREPLGRRELQLRHRTRDDEIGEK